MLRWPAPSSTTPPRKGQTLNANQTTPTIVTIADLSTMTVKAQVSEADVGKLKLGMDAYFTFSDSPESASTGKLRQIEPMPDTENNVVLYYALFDVPNPTGELMMSMSAQVFFVRRRQECAGCPEHGTPHHGGGGLRRARKSGSDRRRAVRCEAERTVEVGVRNRVSCRNPPRAGGR